VRAIRVDSAAADAHPVLGGLNLLNVEAAHVVPRQNAERVCWDTVAALSAGIELAALVGGVETAQVRCIDAASDLADVTTGGTLVLDVFGVSKPIGWKLALVRIIIASLGSAVSFRAGALRDTDISVGILGRDETHISQRIDLDDIVRMVRIAIDIRARGRSGSGGASDEESDDCKGVHSGIDGFGGVRE